MKSLVELLKESKGAAIKDRTPDRFPKPKQPGEYLDMQNEKRTFLWKNVEEDIADYLGAISIYDSLIDFDDIYCHIYWDLNQIEINRFKIIDDNSVEEISLETIKEFFNIKNNYNLTSSQKNTLKYCGLEYQYQKEKESYYYINMFTFDKFIKKSKSFKSLEKEIKNINNFVNNNFTIKDIYTTTDDADPGEFNIKIEFDGMQKFEEKHMKDAEKLQELIAGSITDFIFNLFEEWVNSMKRAF